MFLGTHDVSFHFLQILHCVTLIIYLLRVAARSLFAEFGVQLDPMIIEARANTSTELNLSLPVLLDECDDGSVMVIVPAHKHRLSLIEVPVD